ncbi:hypothetical protein ERJ75_001536600 [Trypanosoma vivax]|nr:hypothetical protein ERJ75_001536600 [Trypanosoma vivax]
MLEDGSSVTVTYDRSLASIPLSDKVTFSVFLKGYKPDSYQPAEHKRLDYPITSKISVDAPYTQENVKLDLVGGLEEMIFVVDVEVSVVTSGESLRWQCVYLLTRKKMRSDYESDLSLDDDAVEQDDEKANSGGSDSDADCGAEYGDVATDSAGSLKGAEGDASANWKNPQKVEFHRVAVDFYFELDSGLFESAEDVRSKMRDWSEQLLYLDVQCIPVGIATVNGQRGYVGDILFDLQDNNEDEKNDSHCVGSSDGGGSCASRGSLMSDLQRMRWIRAACLPEENCNSWSEVPYLVCKCFIELMRATERRESIFRARICAEWHQELSLGLKKLLNTGAVACSEGNCFSHGKVEEVFQPISLTETDDVALQTADCGSHKIFNVSSGSVPCWYHADDSACVVDGAGMPLCPDRQNVPFPRLSKTLFPPHLALSSLSIFPRQLFDAYRLHHRSLIRKDAQLTMRQTANLHVDCAFMRLPRPILPNVCASNLERLPVALHNIERIFCDSIIEGGVQHFASPAENTFCAMENVFSTLLSFIFMLRPSEGIDTLSGSARGGNLNHEVYSLLQNSGRVLAPMDVNHIQCGAVLYRLYPNDSRGSKSFKDGDNSFIFLGSRSGGLTNIIDSSSATLHTNETFFKNVVRVLGIESLGEECVACCGASLDSKSCGGSVIPLLERGGAECYPMASRGIGSRPLHNSTPRLYHPFPWLTLLGAPLFVHDEPAPSSLGSVSPGQMERRHVALTYTPLNTKARKPYRSFSYGRFSRNAVHSQQQKQAASGLEVRKYFSLLLRAHSSPDAGTPQARRFADGILHVYGSPNEPMFLFYQSRQQLRFRLGAHWPFLLDSDKGAASDHDADSSGVEEQLLEQLAKVARDIVEEVVNKTAGDYYPVSHTPGEDDGERKKIKVPPSRVFLLFSFSSLSPSRVDKKLRVSVFPIDEQDNGFEDEEQMMWQAEGGHALRGSKNPHRPFRMRDNVFSRRARHVLVVTYDKGRDKYNCDWDADYEGC